MSALQILLLASSGTTVVGQEMVLPQSRDPGRLKVDRVAPPPDLSTAGPGFVWEVRGMAHPVYLAGSVHYLPPKDSTPLPEPILMAMDRVERVVFEFNPEEEGKPANAAALRAIAGMPNGKTNLWHEVQPETRRLLDQLCPDRSTRDQIAGYAPWMAAIHLHSLKMKELGYPAASGLEQVLWKIAARKRMRIEGLLPPDTHARLFGDLPWERQEQFLVSTLHSFADADQSIRDMAAAWRTGNSRHVEAELKKSSQLDDFFYRRLIEDRNRDWVGKIKKFGQEGPATLVVVGCMHLAGPQSLQRKLARSGLSPRPVMERKTLTRGEPVHAPQAR
jgi:uncharacterized protein YbaP (TraB family)